MLKRELEALVVQLQERVAELEGQLAAQPPVQQSEYEQGQRLFLVRTGRKVHQVCSDRDEARTAADQLIQTLVGCSFATITSCYVGDNTWQRFMPQ